MNKIEKVNLIKKTCKEHNITAYEIGNNTKLSTFAIQKILNGETKNPSEVTVQVILDFLEIAVVGTHLKEIPIVYKTKKTIEDVIAEKVMQKLEPYFKNIENALAENMLEVDDIKELLEENFALLKKS